MASVKIKIAAVEYSRYNSLCPFPPTLPKKETIGAAGLPPKRKSCRKHWHEKINPPSLQRPTAGHHYHFSARTVKSSYLRGLTKCTAVLCYVIYQLGVTSARRF